MSHASRPRGDSWAVGFAERAVVELRIADVAILVGVGVGWIGSCRGVVGVGSLDVVGLGAGGVAVAVAAGLGAGYIVVGVNVVVEEW